MDIEYFEEWLEDNPHYTKNEKQIAKNIIDDFITVSEQLNIIKGE